MQILQYALQNSDICIFCIFSGKTYAVHSPLCCPASDSDARSHCPQAHWQPPEAALRARARAVPPARVPGPDLVPGRPQGRPGGAAEPLGAGAVPTGNL